MALHLSTKILEAILTYGAGQPLSIATVEYAVNIPMLIAQVPGSCRKLPLAASLSCVCFLQELQFKL